MSCHFSTSLKSFKIAECPYPWTLKFSFSESGGRARTGAQTGAGVLTEAQLVPERAQLGAPASAANQSVEQP